MHEAEKTTALMNPSELAGYIGMAERTILQWAAQHKVPAIKIGASWRFRKSEIDAWLEDNHSGPSYEAAGDGRRFIPKMTKWKEQKNREESEKALLAACSAYIMTTIQESTISTFFLDLFTGTFDVEIVNKTVNALNKQKKLKLNRKFKDDNGNITTVVERR